MAARSWSPRPAMAVAVANCCVMLVSGSGTPRRSPSSNMSLKSFKKIDLHLRVEAAGSPCSGPRTSTIFDAPALSLRYFNQHARCQTAFGAEDERLCKRRGVEPDQQICRGEPSRARPCRHRQRSEFLCNRVEDRLAGLGPRAVTGDKDRAIAALNHCTGPAHRRVEKPKPLGRRGLAETPRQLWRDGAHLNHSAVLRRGLDQARRAEDRGLDAFERRQDLERRRQLLLRPRQCSPLRSVPGLEALLPVRGGCHRLRPRSHP